MSNHKTRNRFILYCGAIALVCLAAPLARAGGPLLLGPDGRPVKWAAREIRGGVLNSQTVGIVNGVRQIFYHVDAGTLGPMNNNQASALVDRIFREYSDISTADIDFVNGGPILDPTTGQPVNVDGSNAGRFLSSSNPTFQNPIIFDTDGAIAGTGGVLGFFTFLQVDGSADEIREGAVVLNGVQLNRGTIDPKSFLGVFTHEFGHFAGPLDHAQLNGNIASRGTGSALPSGYTPQQAYDVFGPFVETLFPFLFDGAAGSSLFQQFPESGFFVATLDMDTQNALSNLYPSATYLAERGSIEGRVVIRLPSGDIPLRGINVIARRIDQGAYPPVSTTQAFIGVPPLDPDGIPLLPPPQASTDSLVTVSCAVTGMEFGDGYRIQGLPPGQYMVGIQQLNPNAIRGSGIGPLEEQLPLPFVEEFFNGPTSSSNTPTVFTPVTVTAGGLATGVDIILNGITLTTFQVVPEVEPNDKMKKPPNIGFPVEVNGSAAFTDPGIFKMTLPDGSKDVLEDTYKFTVDRPRLFFIMLESTSGSGDLDLYLFDEFVAKKKSSFNDPSLIGASTSPLAKEIVAVRLVFGTFKIGISAFSGSMNYRLRVIATDN
jgi:hypothetical protein